MTDDLIKFLIVDDTPENLVALEALLRRDGLEVLTASSGAEALEVLLVHDVALAILDVQMPEMDGFELAELMRGAQRTRNVPIIFVTAGARDPQRVFKGYETGAVDFLYKPIEPRILKGKADVFFDLYRQRRELAQSLRLTELFMGVLGHDLRNPLGAMIAGAQLLELDPKDDRQALTLRRMLAAGKRMSAMIEQLLDLTRVRLGTGFGFTAGVKRVDLRALVQQGVDELRAAHPDREIRLDASGECVTAGDADRLLQLFSNIIGNAIHHGTAGTPVTISVGNADGDVIVRVGNKGVIPPNLLPTLFDPFRSREASSSKTPGLGLGLFIAQQIAIAHGGRVTVESNETSGTVFTVRIPRRAVSDSRA